MPTFTERVARLPGDVQKGIVEVRGFENELEVADAVTEDHDKAQDGSVVVTPAEVVFT